MTITTKQQAIDLVAKNIANKFNLVDQTQKVSGIHLGRVRIIETQGYGENKHNDNIYTPSSQLSVSLSVERSSQGHLKIYKFTINGVDQYIPLGGLYISNVTKSLKSI